MSWSEWTRFAKFSLSAPQRVILAFIASTLLFLASLSVTLNNGQVAGLNKQGELALHGTAPFFAQIRVQWIPVEPTTQTLDLVLTSADGQTLVLPGLTAFKKKRYWPWVTQTHWRLTSEVDSERLRFRVDYASYGTVIALLSSLILAAVFSWFCFYRHPLSYLSWGAPYLVLIAYVAASSGGLAQYALGSLLLVVAHLVWMNPHIPLHRTLAFLCYASIYPALLVSAGHYAISGQLQSSELVAILQSNLDETMDYVRDFIGWWRLALGGTILMSAGLWMTWAYRRQSPASTKLNISGMALASTLALGFTPGLGDYPAYKQLHEARQEYQAQIDLWHKQKEARAGIKEDVKPSLVHDEITVLVIGESLSRHHMGLYGYQRDTTPLLQKTGNLVVFRDAISNYTQTLQSIFHMLTNSKNDQPVPFGEARSLINIARSAGLETYWISNQIRYGFTDNWTSILAADAEHVYFEDEKSVSRERYAMSVYDEALFPEISRTLDSRSLARSNNSKLIIVHLFGSHRDYARRYPPSYDVFKDKEPVRVGPHETNASESEFLNAYDNSVRYNDFVIWSIIEQLRQLNCTCSLVYSSDHGEDVVHNLAHDARHYNPLMVEIPLLFWHSERWGQRYPRKLAVMQQHQNAPFMNDDLFYLMIGLTNLETPLYKADRDLSSHRYKSRPRYTLHGKVDYDGSRTAP